jgi:Flp pilus assembly pilin Flp
MTRQQRAADLLVASGIGWAMRILRRWMLDERGMETVEYAILAGLMVAAIVAILFALGDWVFKRTRLIERSIYGPS